MIKKIKERIKENIGELFKVKTGSESSQTTTILSNNNVIAIIAIALNIFMFFALNIIVKLLGFVISLMKDGVKYKDFISFLGGSFLRTILRVELRFFSLYIVALVLMIILDIYLFYKFKVAFTSLDTSQKASSRFATLEELKEQYREIPEKTIEYEGKTGVIISRFGDKILIDDSPTNNIILGATRSGKGETIIVPNIDIYSRSKDNYKPSIIINDPKGEISVAAYETLKKRGYEVYVLNLLDPLNSMSYNPLQLIIDAYKNEEYSTAQLLCNTLTFSLYNDPTAKDKYWQNSAMALVNGLILALTHDSIERNDESKVTMFTVANMLSELGGTDYEDGTNALDLFFQKRKSNDIAKMQYATSKFASGSTRGSLFSITMTGLQKFIFEEIAKMTSKNSIDLEKVGFGEKPIAIFMITPDFDASNHAIASIFVRQLYFVLAKKASLSGGECTREVRFELDEFGNMPAIEGFANIITVCLGRNIRFNLAIQSFSQLENIYGRDSKTIIANCGNLIYLKTNDLSTAKECSEMVGEKTLVSVSRSGGKLSTKKSFSESTDKRRLLDPNEIMNLRKGESVVIRSSKREDNKNESIVPYPIYNRDETLLKYRYMYLSDEFDTSKKLEDLYKIIDVIHRDVKISDLTYENNDINLEEDTKFENLLLKDKLNEATLKIFNVMLNNISEEKFKIKGLQKLDDYGDMAIVEIDNLISKLRAFISDDEYNNLVQLFKSS